LIWITSDATKKLRPSVTSQVVKVGFITPYVRGNGVLESWFVLVKKSQNQSISQNMDPEAVASVQTMTYQASMKNEKNLGGGSINFKKMHSHVRWMKQMLRPSYTDSTGLLNGMRRCKVLRVKVSKERVERALHFMGALIGLLQSRGAYFVKMADPERHEIRISEERIECVLIEETKRTKNPSDDPKQSHWLSDRWKWAATGRFRFEIQEWPGTGLQKQLIDSKECLLENQISNIVEGLLACAEALRQRLVDRQARERQREDEQRQMENARGLHEAELARRRDREALAEQWAISAKLREFIKVCEMRLSERNGGIPISTDTAGVEWIFWAKTHADRLDPFKTDFLARIASGGGGKFLAT
jgi:hypothetical protein